MAYLAPKSAQAEIKRLTQKANRRIAAAMKEYERAGRTIAPRELVGGIQTKSQWQTGKAALSRTVRFGSEQEYKEHMRFLKSFDLPDSKGGKPTITQYRKIQAAKIEQAVATSLGTDLVEGYQKKFEKMSAPEQAKFWEQFSDNAQRKGIEYSSGETMENTLSSFFHEDIEDILEV